MTRAFSRMPPLVHEKLAELESLVQELKSAIGPNETVAPPPEFIDEAKIRQILVVRRIRDQQLGRSLFLDPAWDILLEAFAAKLGNKPISAVELSQSSSVGDSTGRRWIKALEQHGWLYRSEGDDPARQVELTADGLARLRRFFNLVGPASTLV